jgi:hypothetical protein
MVWDGMVWLGMGYNFLVRYGLALALALAILWLGMG